MSSVNSAHFINIDGHLLYCLFEALYLMFYKDWSQISRILQFRQEMGGLTGMGTMGRMGLNGESHLNLAIKSSAVPGSCGALRKYLLNKLS